MGKNDYLYVLRQEQEIIRLFKKYEGVAFRIDEGENSRTAAKKSCVLEAIFTNIF